MENIQLQFQGDFIDRLAEQDVVPQRIVDGYFNATAMCKASGKKMNHYLSNETTRAFIQALSADTGIPASGLVQSVKGGMPNLQGTWVHPQVVAFLQRSGCAQNPISILKNATHRRFHI